MRFTLYIFSCTPGQSSVLGPTLFTLYTPLFSHIITEHDVEHHLYADD